MRTQAEWKVEANNFVALLAAQHPAQTLLSSLLLL